MSGEKGCVTALAVGGNDVSHGEVKVTFWREGGGRSCLFGVGSVLGLTEGRGEELGLVGEELHPVQPTHSTVKHLSMISRWTVYGSEHGGYVR